MKKLAIAICCVIGLLLASGQAEAQSFSSALGLRLGYPWAISYKKFVSAEDAIEVYGGYRWFRRYSWFSVNAAYQHHFDIEGVDGLEWYVGGGAGVTFYNYESGFADGEAGTGLSLHGYLGLQYTFEEVPFSITADWVPSIYLNGYGSGFAGNYGGIGVRYVLSR